MNIDKLHKFLLRTGEYMKQLQSQDPTPETLQKIQEILPVAERAGALVEQVQEEQKMTRVPNWNSTPTMGDSKPAPFGWKKQQPNVETSAPETPLGSFGGPAPGVDAAEVLDRRQKSYTTPQPLFNNTQETDIDALLDEVFKGAPKVPVEPTTTTVFADPEEIFSKLFSGLGSSIQKNPAQPYGLGFSLFNPPATQETNEAVPAPLPKTPRWQGPQQILETDLSQKTGLPPLGESPDEAVAYTKASGADPVAEVNAMQPAKGEENALANLKSMAAKSPQLFTWENLIMALFMGAPATINNYLREKQQFRNQQHSTELAGMRQDMRSRQAKINEELSRLRYELTLAGKQVSSQASPIFQQIRQIQLKTNRLLEAPENISEAKKNQVLAESDAMVEPLIQKLQALSHVYDSTEVPQ